MNVKMLPLSEVKVDDEVAARSECAAQGHLLGHISKVGTVRQSAWVQAVSAFEDIIADFNVRGRRVQIDHPGYCTTFAFCPSCGASLSQIEIKQPDWAEKEARMLVIEAAARQRHEASKIKSSAISDGMSITLPDGGGGL